MALFIRLSLADLEKAWNPVEHIQVRDATIERDPNNLKIADPSDTVLLVAFESHMQHANGLIKICYPFKTIDPVIAKLDAWQD